MLFDLANIVEIGSRLVAVLGILTAGWSLVTTRQKFYEDFKRRRNNRDS